MSVHFGMTRPLAEQIDTHLFVLCPNNSGSTFLKNALRLSRHTWNLAREGQRTFGYVGPRNWQHNRQLIWAGRRDWAEQYVRRGNFDWERTRRAWYAQAVANDPTATVMVEKSPPFLLIADQLVDAFRDVRFVMMTRDPYATYEGIIRRRIANPPDTDDDPRVLAASHIVACFEAQRRNLADHADRSVFFTYETLCADPHGCATAIEALAPVLDDIDFDRRVAVKGMYDEHLRNMNDDQIARLGPDDLAIATRVFEPAAELFASFGYHLR